MTITATILIFLYFIVSILIGIFASRRETPEGFLLGDRDVGSISTFTTIAASKTGGGFFLSLVAFTYLYGIGAIWYIVGLAVGFLVFYWFAQNRLKDEADQNQYYTLADYVFKGYGKLAGYLSALLSFLILSSGIVLQFTSGSKSLFEITGLNFNFSLLLIAGVILIYLIMGGFKAVVRTDAFQYAAIVAMVILILFGLLTLGKINSEYLNIWEVGPVNIITFIIFGIIIPFYTPEFYQRIYATKNKETLKKAFTLSMTIYPLVALAILFMGLVIRTHLPDIDQETALIRGLIQLLPAWFMGLGGVLMFSAIMSSADTYVFTDTSVFLQDFVLRHREVTKERLVKYFRIVMVIIIMLGVIASYLLRSIVFSAYLWAAIGTILGTGIIATWVFKKLSGLALSLGFILGLLAFLYVLITNSFSPMVVGYSMISVIIGLAIGSISLPRF